VLINIYRIYKISSPISLPFFWVFQWNVLSSEVRLMVIDTEVLFFLVLGISAAVWIGASAGAGEGATGGWVRRI
jgi:hypothetical protein